MRRALLTLALLFCASPAAAQHIFESVGERALGMAGAFVAVADDPTAVYWNPAGLVHGQPLGATIGWHRSRFGNPDAAPHPGAQSGRSSLATLGTWPLGGSYANIETTTLRPAPGTTLLAETLQTRHYGVTILQSIVSGLVVGSTLYVVWTEQRQEHADAGRFVFGRDLSNMLRAPADDVVMFKIAYWFQR